MGIKDKNMKGILHKIAHLLKLNARIEETYYEEGGWLMTCVMCETCFKRTKIRVEGESYFDRYYKPLCKK